MKILGVIPARYASTRFPAKALADIHGKSMIQRVYEQAIQSEMLARVIVATDDVRIYEHVKAFTPHVLMTSISHQSGTDRCAEAYKLTNENFDFIVNIQGDEPFIKPQQIDLLCTSLDKDTELATLIKKIEDKNTLFNPNVVKVVIDTNHHALYFSRHAMPYLRNVTEHEWANHHVYYKHIGIYAYRQDVLQKITRLPVSSLERAESLEQLRWLENGYKIKATQTPFDSIGIDTPDDLEKILTQSIN